MRAWLQKHHAAGGELIVGYYKAHIVAAGQASLTWPQSVAEALCYGWIDGVRHTVDGDRYTIRFTPRRATSKWSAINIRLVGELEAAGRMTDAGRRVVRGAQGSRLRRLPRAEKAGIAHRGVPRAPRQEQSGGEVLRGAAPGYQRMMAWWVMQAKQEETRLRRLDRLISGVGERKAVDVNGDIPNYLPSVSHDPNSPTICAREWMRSPRRS